VHYLLPPRMEADEIAYFEMIIPTLSKKAMLVEWGSGGSTTMFLEHLRPRQKLISIEHNREWFDRVSEILREHPKRHQLTYIYVRPRPDQLFQGEEPVRFWGYGHPFEENPCYLEEYIDPELAVDGIDVFNADLFLVDGIARGACLAAIRMKARKDANVFLHDYKRREIWYDWAVDLYPRKELVGSTLCKLLLI
jgi:hypothetical protein